MHLPHAAKGRTREMVWVPIAMSTTTPLSFGAASWVPIPPVRSGGYATRGRPAQYLYPQNSHSIVAILTHTNVRANYRADGFRPTHPTLDPTANLHSTFSTRCSASAPAVITAATPATITTSQTRQCPGTTRSAESYDVELWNHKDQQAVE